MRRGLIILVLSFVLIAAVYRRTPMNFLRAESGWFLFHAYSTSEIQQHFQKGFFLASYGGHYAPLAFGAEFETAKIAGTNESIWKWRQILALTLISAALVGTLYAVGGAFQLPTLTRWMMAVAVTAGSVYRPEMMDFISWPFMIFQLVFLGLLILALYSVLRVVTSPDQRRWPWMAVLAAYGSMHVSGLGLVAVSAVAVVLGGILLLAFRSPDTIYHPQRKRIASALITMLCLAAAHGWAMLHLLAPYQPLVVSAGPFCKLLLGFTANLAVTGLRTFIGTTISEPDSRSLRLFLALRIAAYRRCALAASLVASQLAQGAHPGERHPICAPRFFHFRIRRADWAYRGPGVPMLFAGCRRHRSGSLQLPSALCRPVAFPDDCIGRGRIGAAGPARTAVQLRGILRDGPGRAGRSGGFSTKLFPLCRAVRADFAHERLGTYRRNGSRMSGRATARAKRPTGLVDAGIFGLGSNNVRTAGAPGTAFRARGANRNDHLGEIFAGRAGPLPQQCSIASAPGTEAVPASRLTRLRLRMPGVVNFRALRQEPFAAPLATPGETGTSGLRAHARAKTVLILSGALRAL